MKKSGESFCIFRERSSMISKRFERKFKKKLNAPLGLLYSLNLFYLTLSLLS